MTMRLLVILALVFQSLFAATGGAVVSMGNDSAELASTGCSTAAGTCCCGPVCGSCADAQMACGCGDSQPPPPAAPVSPSSGKSGTTLLLALLPAAIITAGPSVPTIASADRDSHPYTSHNQKHALLCVWLT